MGAAVMGRKVQVLRVLLSNDAVMADAVKDKTRLLFLAAQNDHVETLKVLLDQLDAQVNIQDDRGESLLAKAAFMGNVRIVQFLLQDPNIHVNVQDIFGRCPLSSAVRLWASWFIHERLKHCSIIVHAMVTHPDIDTNLKDDEGHTPLSLAICTGQWALVEPILEHSKTRVSTEDGSDWTKSLSTLIEIMTPRADRMSEELTVAQYAEKVFQYFVEKRDSKIDWTQEDAAAPFLDLLEQKRLNDTHLEIILRQFPLNLPVHGRRVESLAKMLLRKGSGSATEIIFKYSTFVPNLSSDEWLSRIEIGLQQTDAQRLDSYYHVLWRLIERDISFPKYKDERLDHLVGKILLGAATSPYGDQIFKTLSGRENIDFNYRDYNNCTALWHAADKGMFENIKQLLSIEDIEVHHEDNTDHEPAVLRLLEYIKSTSISRYRYPEFKRCADPLLRRNTILRNGMLLIRAATLGQQDVVRALLEFSSTNPNERGDDAATPLISASMNGHTAIVELLLSDQRVISTLENKVQQTALHAAILNGHSDVASLLVKRDNITWTRFCNDGLVNELNLLFTVGLPQNIQDSIGRTPLHLACSKGYVRMVEELVKAGLDVNMEDNYGETPLRLATRGQHVNVVKALVLGSADMKGLTRDDWLILHNEGGAATVLEITKNAVGQRTWDFKTTADIQSLWGTTTDVCCLTSFHNQAEFVSKLAPTFRAALDQNPGRAIVTGLVQDQIAHFGANFHVPFTQGELSASALAFSWHNHRVAWKMHNTTSEVLRGQLVWETVGYASSLPCGWIPDTASDFLAMLVFDAEKGWILFLDQADEYLGHQ
ncbi:hypothetical protein E8E14_008704 [Neopestalotiopsis sp. 37M]|nr:hypothetical protein E8E14_008704 [Neopestalotiopsis sp. 37M]